MTPVVAVELSRGDLRRLREGYARHEAEAAALAGRQTIEASERQLAATARGLR